MNIWTERQTEFTYIKYMWGLLGLTPKINAAES